MNFNPFFFFMIFGAFVKIIWEVGMAFIVLAGQIIVAISSLIKQRRENKQKEVN